MSDDVLLLPLYLLLGTIGLWLTLSALFYLNLRVISSLDLVPLDEGELRDRVGRVVATGFVDPGWLDDNRFEPVNAYEIVSRPCAISMVVWRHAENPTFLCVYFVASQRAVVEIHTALDSGSLMTGSSHHGQSIPHPPGRWTQTSDAYSVAELWQRHEEGLFFLRDVLRQHLAEGNADIREIRLSEVRDGLAFLRTLPFWPLRMPYWHFIYRRLHGKSIREQVEAADLNCGKQQHTFGSQN